MSVLPVLAALEDPAKIRSRGTNVNAQLLIVASTVTFVSMNYKYDWGLVVIFSSFIF